MVHRMRKSGLVLIGALSLAAGVVAAEVAVEAVPAEQLQLYAPIAAQLIQQQFPNPPVKVDVDTTKAQGYHIKEKVGMFLLPDKAVTADALKTAGDKGVPIGILVTKDLSVQEKDAPAPPTRIAIADLNGQVKLPVFYVTVKAKGDERFAEVFSKDEKPLATIPLKKIEAAGDTLVSLKLQNVDEEKKQLDAVLTLAGGHEFTLRMGTIEP